MRGSNGHSEKGYVFTFRLNPDLPHENKALRYLLRKKNENEGGTRKVVGDALLLAAENEQQLQEIAEMQRRALSILERLESGSIVVNSNGGSEQQPEEEEGAALTEEFKAGLLKIARPKLRLEELAIEDD